MFLLVVQFESDLRERERASEHHCYTKKILMKEYLELRYEEEMNLIQAED